MRSLDEIKNYLKDTVITELYLDGWEKPFYFLGDQNIGWGEYIDFSNFDPFEILGFKTATVSIGFKENSEASWDHTLEAQGSLQETIENALKLHPDVYVN